MDKVLLMTPDQGASDLETVPPTVAEALLRVVRHPYDRLIRKWNWKSALTSSLFRAPIFFFVNLTAGRKAAAAAFLTELVLRSVTSGFYGSLTEAIGEAEPAWLAGLTAALLMPLGNHSLELLVHWLRGTPKLWHSILASMCFTAFSTLFNLYVMRRGALLVGEKRQPFAQDMRRMPRLVIGFIVAGPLAIIRMLKRRETRGMPLRPVPDWENEGG
jgi:hypothetical protein